MNTEPVLDPDAAMVLGIASTAMPFARTPEAAAERWLRVLRVHGEVGTALRALGVSEGPLGGLGGAEGGEHGEGMDDERTGRANVDQSIDHEQRLAQVTEHAVRVAGERGSAEVTTTDVLMGVMHIYGADFDRVLRAHGIGRDELVEQLGVTVPG